MTLQRWNTRVSVLAFALVVATAGSARAQWGYSGTSGYPSVSPFGHEYGTGNTWGSTPYDYGSSGGLSYSGSGGIGAFTHSSDGPSNGPMPQTTPSFQQVSSVVTLVPDWSGSAHRIHRRYQARRRVPRAAIRGLDKKP